MSNYDRYMTAHMRAQERQWRLGFEAGLRERRRLVAIGVVIAVLVILRRHVSPVAALAWTVSIVLVFAPLLVFALVFEVVRRRRKYTKMVHRWDLLCGLVKQFPPDPAEDATADRTEPYRLISTSRQRHTETRRYADGSIRTVDTRTGEELAEG